MSRSVVASVLSLLVPGLGQFYLGRGDRGAAILLAVMVVGNLNAIWLTLDSMAQPEAPIFWTSELPRILHDWFAAYGILFWIWQVVDAGQQAAKSE